MEPKQEGQVAQLLQFENAPADRSKQHAVDALPEEQETMDVYAELIHGNPFPLIAAIDHIDLQHKFDDGSTVLHKLCGLSLPLDELLKGRDIEFTLDSKGQTPLHYAVELGDVQAVYWCLQHDSLINQRNQQAMSAVMEAVKKGFRSGFMLCAHFGHLDEQLPHVAASVNDVWTLRFLRTLKVDLNKKNPGGITPLGVAAHNFGYDAAYFLANSYPEKLDLIEVVAANDNPSMVRKFKMIKQDYNYGVSVEKRVMKPTFIREVFALLSLFFIVNSLPEFAQLLWINVVFMLQFALLIFMYTPVSHPPKRAINILAMMKPPHFPAGMEICPDCIQIKQESYQHCDTCGTCVKRFHKHDGSVCIYEGNQGRWYLKELLWLVIFWMIVGLYLTSLDKLYTTTFIRHFEAIELLFHNSSHYLTGVPLYLFCYFWLIKKLLTMLCLTQMVVTGYTYQELMHNERYPYLYRPVKVGQNYRNKRIYLFDEGVLWGLKRACSNILRFFF